MTLRELNVMPYEQRFMIYGCQFVNHLEAPNPTSVIIIFLLSGTDIPTKFSEYQSLLFRYFRPIHFVQKLPVMLFTTLPGFLLLGEFILFTKRHTYLLPLLSMLILVGALHSASSNAVLPDKLYATQHFEEAVDILHDIRDALHRSIDDIWYDSQKEVKSVYNNK